MKPIQFSAKYGFQGNALMLHNIREVIQRDAKERDIKVAMDMKQTLGSPWQHHLFVFTQKDADVFEAVRATSERASDAWKDSINNTKLSAEDRAPLEELSKLSSQAERTLLQSITHWLDPHRNFLSGAVAVLGEGKHVETPAKVKFNIETGEPLS